MTVIVTACAAFGLTVSESKAEIMCLQNERWGARAVDRYCSRPGVQTRFSRRYCTGVSRGVRARLTTADYGRPITRCSSECLGWRKRKREDDILSYANALLKTDSESVETTVRGRRIFFAGFVARMGEERRPRRVMFEEMFGGKGYSGGLVHGVRLDEGP